MEPALTAFMSDVSKVLHNALPNKVLKAHELPVGCPEEAAQAYQYPRLRAGCPSLSSHQVVIRGPRGETRGGEGGEAAARMSVSDLHVDRLDGGGELGSCTVHTCRNTDDSHSGDNNRPVPCRGLAVFPERTGGRGVYIASMVPGWHCAMLMQTARRLHGSVLPGEEDEQGFGGAHVDMMRIITYPLKAVDNLLRRLAGSPEQMQAVKTASCTWIQRRMCDKHTGKGTEQPTPKGSKQ